MCKHFYLHASLDCSIKINSKEDLVFALIPQSAANVASLFSTEEQEKVDTFATHAEYFVKFTLLRPDAQTEILRCRVAFEKILGDVSWFCYCCLFLGTLSLSLCLTVSISVSVSVCLSVCLCLSVCVSVCLCLSLSVFHPTPFPATFRASLFDILLQTLQNWYCLRH